MILRALSEYMGIKLNYDTRDELLTRCAELAPHLVKFDYVEPSGFDHLAHGPRGEKEMFATPFVDSVDNFYMTDSISRNSAIMARCTKELNPKKLFNFRSPVYG